MNATSSSAETNGANGAESAAAAVPTPSGISATWFDGKTARRQLVRLQISSRTIAVVEVTNDVAGAEKVIAHVPRDLVRVSERIANTPYRLQFPDGALAISDDHCSIEASFQLSPRTHWLSRMERASWAVVIALIGLFGALYAAYEFAIPRVAAAVAERVPRAAEATLGETTFETLDGRMFTPTKLNAAQQSQIADEFQKLAKAAGLEGEVTLKFRAMQPNALAIPGGTIVVTDGLVKLFKDDTRMVSAVLAHELGHVHHRHSLKHLLEGSVSALIVGALAGDVSGVSAMVTAAPVILSTLKYTRESEREADQYAFELLRKVGRSPQDFADAMQRLELMELCFALQAKSTPGGADASTADEFDIDPDTEDRSRSDARKQRNATTQARRAACIEGLDQTIAGRETEITQLRKQSREGRTGYMHTHPVTGERIRAAESAGK